MTGNLDKYRKELSHLRQQATVMIADLGLMASPGVADTLDPKQRELIEGSFAKLYQRWYTAAREVVAQLVPARLTEFETAYRPDARRKGIEVDTYRIQDWLHGLTSRDRWGNERFSGVSLAYVLFQTQMGILEAAEARLDSAVFSMSQIVQADLFDGELDAAGELLKRGFVRAAGALAGVVLERHLAGVAKNHALKIVKKNPTIADLNDPLRSAEVYDVPTWRLAQRLGDIRNYCDHSKDREPTVDEVGELISGTSKIAKTVA